MTYGYFKSITLTDYKHTSTNNNTVNQLIKYPYLGNISDFLISGESVGFCILLPGQFLHVPFPECSVTLFNKILRKICDIW
jgi:hypothetical protein